MSNDVDIVRVAHCSLCVGFGGRTRTQLRLEHAIFAHTQCVLTGLGSIASQLAKCWEGSGWMLRLFSQCVSKKLRFLFQVWNRSWYIVPLAGAQNITSVYNLFSELPVIVFLDMYVLEEFWTPFSQWQQCFGECWVHINYKRFCSCLHLCSDFLLKRFVWNKASQQFHGCH